MALWRGVRTDDTTLLAAVAGAWGCCAGSLAAGEGAGFPLATLGTRRNSPAMRNRAKAKAKKPSLRSERKKRKQAHFGEQCWEVHGFVTSHPDLPTAEYV